MKVTRREMEEWKRRGVEYVVTPAWVEKCIQRKYRVNEEDYRVTDIVEDEGEGEIMVSIQETQESIDNEDKKKNVPEMPSFYQSRKQHKTEDGVSQASLEIVGVVPAKTSKRKKKHEEQAQKRRRSDSKRQSVSKSTRRSEKKKSGSAKKRKKAATEPDEFYDLHGRPSALSSSLSVNSYPAAKNSLMKSLDSRMLNSKSKSKASSASPNEVKHVLVANTPRNRDPFDELQSVFYKASASFQSSSSSSSSNARMQNHPIIGAVAGTSSSPFQGLVFGVCGTFSAFELETAAAVVQALGGKWDVKSSSQAIGRGQDLQRVTFQPLMLGQGITHVLCKHGLSASFQATFRTFPSPVNLVTPHWITACVTFRRRVGVEICSPLYEPLPRPLRKSPAFCVYQILFAGFKSDDPTLYAYTTLAAALGCTVTQALQPDPKSVQIIVLSPTCYLDRNNSSTSASSKAIAVSVAWLLDSAFNNSPCDSAAYAL